MVVVYCTSPQCDPSVYEVTSFHTFEVMPQTRFHDPQMDVQTDRHGDSTLFVGV